MKCPYCSSLEDKVVDSRLSKDGKSIRRRRECLECSERFTTYEYIEEVSLMVIKTDGRREPFDRQKLLKGIRIACTKRPVPMDRLEQLVSEIESEIYNLDEREISTKTIGEIVMAKLRELDEVAYVRFASVYRDFKDKNEFMQEVRKLLG